MLFCIAGCNNEKAADTTTAKSNTVSEEQQLKDAVKRYPDSLLIRENLIQFYTDKGDYGTAIKEVDNAIAKDSNMARLWDIRAIIHFQDADTVNAIKDFEHAINISALPEYVISLGTLYAQTKNPLAITTADAILKSNAKAEKEALFIKGLYYSFTNEKEKAIVFFDKCIAMNYTFMDGYREKAIALYDLGKYEEALAVLDKALTLQNNFDEGYYYSGKCLEKLNRIPEAIQSYQNAVQLDPDYIEAKEALGRLGVKS